MCFTLHRELVRKKAVMAMHRFFLLSPGSVSHLEDDFRRCLSDKDPGVMEASLLLFHDLIKVVLTATLLFYYKWFNKCPLSFFLPSTPPFLHPSLPPFPLLPSLSSLPLSLPSIPFLPPSQSDPSKYKDLTESFVSILSQVLYNIHVYMYSTCIYIHVCVYTLTCIIRITIYRSSRGNSHKNLTTMESRHHGYR